MILEGLVKLQRAAPGAKVFLLNAIQEGRETKLVAMPKILLFDEATSGLDNETQKLVTDNLASQDITRLVIAHRLSTVRQADRIIVLDRGQVVQVGSYAELIAVQGTFKSLIERQLA